MQPVVSMIIMLIIICVASFITVAGIALIALGSSGVFSSKDTYTKSTTTTTVTISSATATSSVTTTSSTATSSATTTAGTVAVSSINDASNYPNGSYSANLTSFSAASNTLTLLPVDATTLTQLGGIDNSSTIIEAGRAQYLYFHLPNDTSIATTQSSSNSKVKRNVNSTQSANVLSGPNIVTGIAIHFIDSNSNDTVIVIPIVNDTTTTTSIPTGIFFYTLPDGSVVVLIDISIPTALCPKINGQPVDVCLSISYAAYIVVNNSQITAPLIVDVQMACGDVCSLPQGLCSASCMTCNGQQVAGYHTPVTRRYDMGTTSGSFQFYYETYVIQDRITVWNSGSLLFDTGCVGATNTTTINFSSNSTYIRVDVEPDCACPYSYGCGTAWIFTVFCMNSTNTTGSIATQNRIARFNGMQDPPTEAVNFEKYLYKNRYQLTKL